MERSSFVALAWTGLAACASPLVVFAGSPTVPQLHIVDYRIHGGGNFRCLMNNLGQVGSRRGSGSPGSTAESFEWPTGSGVDYLWVAGAWFGAIKDGEPHVSQTAYGSEVRSGPTSIDRIYVGWEGAANGARHPAPNADDDGDGRFDEDRLNGYDDDLDGRVDEDFAGISDQMFASEYNDSDPAIPPANPGHVPLGVRVEQTSFVWADPRINSVFGLRYTIQNQGFNPLENFYLGLFADCDIGPRDGEDIAEEDRAGFWEGDVTTELGGDPRTVRVSVGYMYDSDGDADRSPGYIGFVFLGARQYNGQPVPATLANFRLFSGRAAFVLGGDPTNDEERYQVLTGTAPQSLPAPDPGTGLHPPITVTRADDYRIVVSAGPIATVEPGEKVEVSYAIVVGIGLDGLIANAARAVALYENDWRPEGPVAVRLQDFAAVAHDRAVQLSWRLRDAHEASAVRVQRALAEVGPWEEIAVLVPAADMQFEDRDVAPGETFYRLVLESADGTVQPQRAIAVRAGAATGERVALAPPIERRDGVIELRYTLSESGPHELSVFDVQGQRVSVIASGDAGAGSHLRLWYPAASGMRLVRGVYFVRLASSGASSSRKLVVLGKAGVSAFRP